MTHPNCPNCKAVVEIPADHFEATIHCGICWAEVIVERPPAEAKDESIEELVAASPPQPRANPFKDVPGRPAKEMEPLEDLLRDVSVRMPQLFNAPPPLSEPEPVEEEPAPHRAVARRQEEDGLRRKRGIASSIPQAAEPPPWNSDKLSKLALMILTAIVVFIVGYFLMR